MRTPSGPVARHPTDDERTSILVLEANDIQLSNANVAFEAFRQANAEREAWCRQTGD